MLERNASKLRVCVGIPSKITVPSVGMQRSIAKVKVDLPDPVRPTVGVVRTAILTWPRITYLYQCVHRRARGKKRLGAPSDRPAGSVSYQQSSAVFAKCTKE